MKKFTSFILAAALGMALLTGCGPEKPAETSAAGSADSQTAAASSDAEASVPETSEKESSEAAAAGKESSGGSGDGTVIRVGGLKGPTTMGLVKLMDDAENGKAQNDYEFTMVTAADELTALVAGNKVDIALLPANVAGVLYNKTKGGISVIDVNTLGVLYLVSSDTSVTSIDQLKGKTIYLTGKGTTPEYSLRYLMSAAGLTEDDVTLEFKSEPAEVASVLAEDPSRIGLLPQPFVTSALAQNESLSVILDLTKAWDEAQEQAFREITSQLRCPKCQNNSIADSNAMIAADMRQKVYELMQQGKTKGQIVDYMVARYGHFVSYEPPLTVGTVLLWLGPGLFVLAGAGVIIARARRRDIPDAALSAEERQRLAALLKEGKER